MSRLQVAYKSLQGTSRLQVASESPSGRTPYLDTAKVCMHMRSLQAMQGLQAMQAMQAWHLPRGLLALLRMQALQERMRQMSNGILSIWRDRE
jgi:hypothetical protein